MKKTENYLKENWLLIFIMIQPIIDLIAYIQTKFLGNSFSWIIRLILLILVSIYIFYNSKNKKRLIIYLLPFGVYFLCHIINLYRINSLNLILDIKYFVLIFQMPILTILLIDYIKENSKQIEKIKKGIVLSFIFIMFIIFLSFVTKTYEITYEYSKTGIIGWFTGSNTPSMILCALVPWILCYFFKKNKWYYFAACILGFIALYFNATKACYITLVLSFIIMLFNSIISKVKQEKYFKIFITLLFLVLSLTLYKFSFTYTNVKMANNNISQNQEIIENIINKDEEEQFDTSDKYDIFKDEIKNLTEEEKNIYEMLKTSHIYFELMKTRGVKPVINEMRDIVSAVSLANNRLLKKVNARIESKSADLISKIFGIGYSRFAEDDYDLETDISAIYYYYGYIGTALYLSFIGYFVIKLGIKFLKKPSIILDPECVVLIYLVVLLIFGGEYSGAFLRKPNANIYLTLYLVLIYFKTFEFKKEKKLKNNKISFLLLHLGYGGIESSTINTANALSEKFDIELISFYRLKKNQTKKINKNIKVKYLTEDEPNREEFKTSLKKHKYLKTIKEGFKAIKILINKRRLVKKCIISCDSKYIVSTRYDFSILLSKYGNNDTVKIAQEHHYHNNNKKYIKVLSKKYNKIDYLFALTKTLKSDYEKFLIKNEHTKVVLVPNMLDNISDKTSNLKNKNIVTISRLDKGKRVDDIISAFSKLNDKKLKLYIIGDGDEYFNLKLLIKELKLEKRVILTGYINKQEIEKYLLKSSIFLMASVSEGLPMVLLEAMSYGIPCIAYETDSGISDIIINNKNGYIIKNRNEQEYINKIEKLISDDNLRYKFGIESKKTSYKFSKEIIMKIWLKILKKS